MVDINHNKHYATTTNNNSLSTNITNNNTDIVYDHSTDMQSIKTALQQPILLTAKFNVSLQHKLQILRNQYFPPDRNIVPVHCMLFHNLPYHNIDVMRHQLSDTMSKQQQYSTHWHVTLPSLMKLGKGVAITVQCKQLTCLHKQLQQLWYNDLIAQDKQSYRPHIVIQNKVTPDIAKQTYDELTEQDILQQFSGGGYIIGLELWYYQQNGTWSHITDILFDNIVNNSNT